jgi:hypothetical protein
VDKREASQPDLTSSDQNGATSGRDKATSIQDEVIPSRDKATSIQDEAIPSRDKATSIQDEAIPSRDKATSIQDEAIPSRDKATSIQDGDRPEPVMPPLHIDRGRAQRLRADAQRPLSENLADGIALSHVLLRYARDTPQR